MIAAAVLLLASVGPAFAATSTGDGYSDEGGAIQEQVTGTPPNDNNDGGNGGGQTGSRSSDSSLPFTGVEVGLILAAGVALGGMGLGLRRITRQQPTA